MQDSETKTVAEVSAEAPAPVEAVPAQAADAKPAAKAKPGKAKPARRSKAPAAKLVAEPKKVKARRVKRSRRPQAAKPAARKIERNTTMTFDTNTLFAGLPGADKFQTLFADAGERSQEIVRKSQKTAEELAEIAKANVEALTEAGRIAANGARAIGQDALATSRESIEQASAAVKSLADAKSTTEVFQLQSELARASFDRAVAEGSKLTEQLVKLAGEAVQPLSNRASLNAERINEMTA